MKIHGLGNYSDFVESFFIARGKFTFRLLLMVEAYKEVC